MCSTSQPQLTIYIVKYLLLHVDLHSIRKSSANFAHNHKLAVKWTILKLYFMVYFMVLALRLRSLALRSRYEDELVNAI